MKVELVHAKTNEKLTSFETDSVQIMPGDIVITPEGEVLRILQRAIVITKAAPLLAGTSTSRTEIIVQCAALYQDESIDRERVEEDDAE